MGWKGTVRSIRADYRAAQRRSAAADRQQAIAQKQHNKARELDQAASEAEDHEDLIYALTSVHRVIHDAVDWYALARTPAPVEPVKSDTHQTAARAQLDAYNPGAISKLLGFAKTKQKLLQDLVHDAEQNDIATYNALTKKWKSDHADWIEGVEHAKAVLAADGPTHCAMLVALTDFPDALREAPGFRYSVSKSEGIEIQLDLPDLEIIPTHAKSLQQSGKLSVKKMTAAARNDIYQDFVSGCALRAASECFAILPVDSVTVNAHIQLLNKATGHIERTLILSVFFVRPTFEQLNLQAVDASDCIGNFVHTTGFNPAKGYSATAPCQLG
ncbi:MAG: hypothetical protein JKY26_17370 [Pseudomonas sp.]|nr:hypothetical protein [Pseudomonas sp.]